MPGMKLSTGDDTKINKPNCGCPFKIAAVTASRNASWQEIKIFFTFEDGNEI